MKRMKNQSGVIDPISIFTVLFLVVTLIVGTAVTTNRGLSLNISEKAAQTSDDTGYVVPTCSCSGKQCGTNSCGQSCGNCGSGQYCSNNTCYISQAPTPIPPVIPIPPPTSNGYDLNTAINSVNDVPGSPGYDCRKGGCGPGSGPVSGYYEYEGKFYAIGGTGNDPSRYNEPKYSPSEIKIAKSDCDVQGGTFVSDIGLCYKADSFTTKEKTDEGFITHITTIYRNLDNGALIDANTIDTIATTTTRTSRDEDINGHGLNTQTTYLTTRDAYTGAVLNNYVTSQYVAPGPIAGTYVPKYSSKAECQQNTDKNAPAYHGQNEYNSCGQYSTSTETWKSVFNTLDTITFGTFSNYAESYAPDKVVLSWKEAGYPTLKACQQDMIEKYHNPHAPASCNTYTPTKEQLSSSIQLGTVLTAEAALLTTGVGYGSGALTGAQALTNGLAISTVYQTGAAASTCVDNPGSPECTEATVYAALSWANVGSAAYLANATGEAIQTARYVNAAVNAVNVAADVRDTINSCSGENSSGVGCAISSVATLLDVGGGALDIAEIAKDFNISGLGSDIGGWPVDIVPTGTTTITDNIPSGNTIGDLTESVIPSNAFTDLSNIDNAVANISVSQLTDLPNAEAIPSLSNTFADDIAANLPINNIDSEVGILNTDVANKLPDTPLTVDEMIDNGTQGLPDLKWDEPAGLTTVDTREISAINSWNLQDNGGGGMSVEDFRKLIQEGNFDWTKAAQDPITGYRLPDGTIFIETGRHKAMALIAEGVTDIQVELWTLPKNSAVDTLVEGTKNLITDNITDPIGKIFKNDGVAVGAIDPNQIPNTLPIDKISSLDDAILQIDRTNLGVVSDLNGYQSGVALGQYAPEPSIRHALENVPDPIDIIKNLNSANSVEEALDTLKQTLRENGVVIVDNPLDKRYEFLAGQNGFDKSITDSSQNFATFVSDGALRVTNEFDKEFVFIVNGTNPVNYIFLHPEFSTLPLENQLKTLTHETGHFIEQFKTVGEPTVISGLEGIMRPNTEYVSSLYGATAALKAPDPVSAGLIGQLELNAQILGNPNGYFDIPKADIAPSSGNWLERNILNPINNLFSNTGSATKDIKNIPAPSKLTTEEAEQVMSLVPDAVKAKYAQAIKETGSLSNVQFDENRFWSMDVKPKDTRLSPDAVEELMDRLTVGTLNAQGNMIISPKGDHMVFIDVDPNRGSSIAKVAKFLEEKAPEIIRDVYVKYGIDIDPNTIKVGDYVGYGVGLDSAGPFRLNVLESGHVVQQATLSSGVITGSSLALATENIPDALRGDDFLPILIQGDAGHPNLVSMTLEEKGFTLEGYVLPKSEVGPIVESIPNMEIRTDQTLIQAALPTSFETYFSPEKWKDILTPEQFSQIGKSPVTATIPDAGVTSVALDIVNVEVPNAFVAGLDVSPISTIVGEIRLQNGEGSATEAGLRTILANWFTDQTKIIDKHNLAIGEFAGDGFKVVGKDKLTPKALSEFVNMTTSLDKNIANAAKGLYGPDAKAAAAFLATNFPDEIYVKVILDQTNARFKFLPGDGYTPVILKTDSNLSKLEKLIKNYKAEFGNSDKIATISPAMMANYTEADLKKAGMKIIETEQGIFLVKGGNPIVEWFNANIWSTKGGFFPSLIGSNKK